MKNSFTCVFCFLLVCVFSASHSLRLQSATGCPNIRLLNGRVKFRQRGRFAKFTCNTGYVLAGERYSICSNGVWDLQPPKCVRGTCTNTPKAPPNSLIFPSHAGAVLNFYCRPGYQLKGPLVLHCDGKYWDNNLPSCIANNTKPKLFCDFEEPDICGWTHDVNHDFDWMRDNYQTPSGSIGTGPSFDHTKGKGKNGYYMYIESSSRNERDTARLISPIFDKTSENTCLEFYYHMFGATTGTLNVYLKKSSDNWPLPSTSAIFSKTGNQGDRWYRAFHSLGSIDQEFQIIIEGIRGFTYVSDTAIDDVRIIDNCNEDEYMTTEEMISSVTSESPPNVESCQHRCGSTDLNKTNSQIITCDCDDSCLENNRCCPDYYDFCVSYESTTNEWTTTDIPNEIQFTKQMEYSKIPQFTTWQSKKYTTTSKTMAPRFPTRITTKKSSVITATPATTKKISITSTKSTQKTVFTSSTKASTIRQKIVAPTKANKTLPIPRTKPVVILQPTTEEIVKKIIPKPTKSPKIIYIKPPQPNKSEITDNDVIEIPIKKDNKDQATFITLTSPVVPLSEEEDDSSFFKEDEYVDKSLDSPYLRKEFDHNEKSEKLYTETNKDTDNHNRFVLLLCLTCGVVGVLVLVGISVILVRRNRLHQCSSRRMGSGNGDSQSDVRYLTSEETIDFSLDKNYDKLKIRKLL